MTHHDKARELVVLLRNPTVVLRQARRDEIADIITALAEETRRLREVLRPFARIADVPARVSLLEDLSAEDFLDDVDGCVDAGSDREDKALDEFDVGRRSKRF